MSSSRPSGGRIWRGMDSQRATAASVAVELPTPEQAPNASVAQRIESARAAGYDQGYQAALADAAAGEAGQRQAHLADMAASLCRAAEAVAAQRAQVVSVAEGEIVALAVELAAALVGHELANGGARGAEALRRTLRLVPVDADLIVRLHPDDLVTADDLQSLVPDRNIRVHPDPEVEAGGCVVDAGPCHIDSQIGPALDRARALLAKMGGDAAVATVHAAQLPDGRTTVAERSASDTVDDGGQSGSAAA